MAHYVPAQNVNSESQKGGSEVKNIIVSKIVQDYGNRSTGIGLFMQAVGQGGHDLSVLTTISMVAKDIIFYWKFMSRAK